MALAPFSRRPFTAPKARPGYAGREHKVERMNPPAPAHLKPLTSMRFLAALWVVFYAWFGYVFWNIV